MTFIRQEALLGAEQQQRLHLSFAMQQAIQVLQMPYLELVEWIKQEVDENPLLEYVPSTTAWQRGEPMLSPSAELPEQPSLYEHLIRQAESALTGREEMAVAEQLIGSLDERGFLTGGALTDAMERVLRKIQQFDPPGIAARSLRESLLLQLAFKGKKDSLAYKIIASHYEELLHNRLPQIARKLGCKVALVKKLIDEEIASLSLRPGGAFASQPTVYLSSDAIIQKRGEQWSIEICSDQFPRFHLREGAGVDRAYCQRAKWLFSALVSRQKTLERLCAFLIGRQEGYLSGENDRLEPMTMQDAAEALGIHLSTVARAVHEKSLFAPCGLIAIRSLFTYDLGNAISNDLAKRRLLELIAAEDKSAPLSDDALALKMAAMGIPLARRTVAKYRKLHKIPPARRRRQW